MIIGTAGHIDHGKSALVEALTGRTVDRLAEERRRGITIDLNFAPLPLESGAIAGVIDVPGHEDLVRTMIAGASGMHLVLLVVAADDGIRPQTLEHLAVVEALGIEDGIAVLTKADLVDPSTLERRLGELRDRLAGSSVRFGEPAVVSARTGEGIAALRDRLVAFPRPTPAADAFRLPVDRSFSVAGVGTVITGTAWSGTVAIGDAVRLLPSGAEGRVRSIEMYGTPAERSVPGARVALGLAGIDRDVVVRGEWAVTADLPWRPTSALDAWVELQAAASTPLTPRTRVRVHLGTAEVMARVVTTSPVEPGGSGEVRLALESPLLARGGDRIVLRSFSPVATLGGGRVLDPCPPARSRPADLRDANAGDHLVAALVRRRADGLPLVELPVVAGIAPAAAERAAKGLPGIRRVGGHLVAGDRLLGLQRSVGAAVEARHRAEPAAPGISLETLRAGLRAPGWLVDAAVEAESKAGRLVVEQGLARRPDFQATVPGGEAELAALVARVVAGGLTAPDVPELERVTGRQDVAAALRIAAREGRVVAVRRDWFVGAQALAGFAEILRELGARGPIAVGDVRDRTGLSRKYLIPLLEWADASGITERRGDLRVVLPRRA